MLTYRNSLLNKKNVIGCGVALKEVKGVCTNVPCVVAFVEKKMPVSTLAVGDMIPPKLGAVPTDVLEIGRIKLLEVHTQYVRPAQPGVSIGHYKISAGTLGAIVYDRRTGAPLILSNNHVLANASDGLDNRSQIGDPEYQPGPYDGGTSADLIGHLYRFLPVVNTSTQALSRRRRQSSLSTRIRPQNSNGNLIDAALAKPVNADMVNPEVLDIGMVTETAGVNVGSSVKKSGRTSGLTTGTVKALSATLNVELDEGRTARFVDQIMTTPMGKPGDSGSLGVTADGKAFGLLFAGSDAATIFNRIDHILEMLSVRLTP